ncbi:MAG: hypothetical protein U1E36_04315 [Rickettsiales bacterium]
MAHHPIVSEARSWIGTRFAHQGRRKKSAGDHGGVDCLGLLVGVARDLQLQDRFGNLLSKSDSLHYSKVPDGNALQQKLAELLYPISPEGIALGDVILFRLDNNPQHLAIVSDYAAMFGIIHAYAPSRKVVEHRLDESWQEKMVAAFRLN